MKILQTVVDDNYIATLKQWTEEITDVNHSVLFHIYVPYELDDGWQQVQQVYENLSKVFPNPQCIGCSANGEIYDGGITDGEIVVSATICEDPDTKITVLPYFILRERMEDKEFMESLQAVSNLRGIEMVSAAEYQRMEDAGHYIDLLPESVEVFGGVAVGDEDHPAYVFANGEVCSYDGTVFAVYSGPNLHMEAIRMFGWKAIGYPFEVTRSDGPIIYELDHKPAYDVYNHYLHIDKDKNFFYEALEFPWEVEVGDGIDGYIRHAKSVQPDGAIVMSSTIPQGSRVRMTYGDPRRMIDHTKRAGERICAFSPDALILINCMGRKLFWAERCNDEVRELARYAPSVGFSALGEIMRYRSTTLLNNLSIVAVAMREGEAKQTAPVDDSHVVQTAELPITARLAIFINTITEELMEKNQQLNEMLYKASHDYLTGMFNRGAIESMIYNTSEENWYLMMFDLDDFKQINDTYGHAEGDGVLQDIANYLVPQVKNNNRIDVGRWGGEEFMVLGRDYSQEEMIEIAECIRDQVKNPEVMHRPITVSIGLTKHQPGESAKDVIDRVDALLYRAKNEGKDRICSDI
ncbi:MAG: GGDEF domain-containing protein [Lachnospiraceae bacterium]|nr:GGDEF domain-containing protein [Lachnospiraceae bacterium]